jgi:predicted MFS family arabinose efflux permease
MKRHIFLVLALLAILSVPVLAATAAPPLAAQAIETPITIPVSGIDFSIVEVALAAFGIGLVYIVNLIKKLIGWTDKKAMIITVLASFAAAAAALLVKGRFSLKPLIFYGLAVLGEMTGWFKFTKKTT